MFAGRQLADGASLAECGVTDEATLYSLARLLGGGKKRKKKTYTKPKKIKHKHKKIKLRVLKFYKVRCPAGFGNAVSVTAKPLPSCQAAVISQPAIQFRGL